MDGLDHPEVSMSVKSCEFHPHRAARWQGTWDGAQPLCGRCYWTMIRHRKELYGSFQRLAPIKKQLTSLLIDVEVLDEVKKRARRHGISAAEFIRCSLSETLDD